MMKTRHVYILLAVLACATMLHLALSTNINVSATWRVNPRVKDGTLHDNGPLFAKAYLYSQKPTPIISLAYYFDVEPQMTPLFFVISEFELPWRTNINKTGWHEPYEGSKGSTTPHATFNYGEREITVPVDIPRNSFYIRMPSIKENNVFLLNEDGSLQRLPFNIRTMEQLTRIWETIAIDHSTLDYMSVLERILKEDSQHAPPGGRGEAPRP